MKTQVAELKDGVIREYTIAPEDFGLQSEALETITVDSPDASLAMVCGVLDNNQSAARAIVALNAGAAIYVAGLSESHQAGVEEALKVIANGKAKNILESLIETSQALARA